MSVATYQLRKLLDQHLSAEEIMYGQKTIPDDRHLYTDLQSFRGVLTVLIFDTGSRLKNLNDALIDISMKKSRGEELAIGNLAMLDSDTVMAKMNDMRKDIDAYNTCVQIIDNRIYELIETDGIKR